MFCLRLGNTILGLTACFLLRLVHYRTKWKGNPGNTKKREKRKNCRIDKQAHCLPLKLFLVLPESANRENSLLNTRLRSMEVVCISSIFHYLPFLAMFSLRTKKPPGFSPACNDPRTIREMKQARRVLFSAFKDQLSSVS
jgi:hypothetical protein